jgi:hypothetical protein
MAATIVGAIDLDAAHAHLAHVAEGDLLGSRCEHFANSTSLALSSFIARRLALAGQ